ncbi:538_t:CDS:2, partial [Cetraspora pellucida]
TVNEHETSMISGMHGNLSGGYEIMEIMPYTRFGIFETGQNTIM